MLAERVSGSVYMVDAMLLGRPKALSTYIILGDDETLIIDPGPPSSSETILKAIGELGVNSAIIAPTHIHIDHAGGSWRLMEELEDAKLYVHPRGAPHMVDPSRLIEASKRLLGKKLIELYGEVRGIEAERVVESRDGEELKLGDLRVKTIWTPGHASHHQCYYIVDEGVLILGDAGGTYHPEAEAITPNSPPPFNPQKAMNSLRRLMELDAKTLCYAHYGYTRHPELLQAYLRQIELWMSIIEEGLRMGLKPKELQDRLRREDPMAEKAWREEAAQREMMNIM
ncbi:hypothetical protein DRO49_01450, partial [Candidatus Bathyarchaeota archaeon]